MTEQIQKWKKDSETLAALTVWIKDGISKANQDLSDPKMVDDWDDTETVLMTMYRVAKTIDDLAK